MKMGSWFLPGSLAMAFAFNAAAQAPAAVATKFKVAPAQIQALDIQTLTLADGAKAAKRAYPAQVVAPAGAEQVVSSPFPGLVVQLHIEPLQAVRAGAPLVRIASAELGQLQLQLMQAATRFTLAQQTAKREQGLFSEGITAQRRVQESQSALSEAQAALGQAKAALRLAGMAPGVIDRIAAGNPEDGLTLNAARAGVVTQVLVKPGQRVDAASALLLLAQSDALALEIQVPAAEAGQLPIGTAVDVTGIAAKARIVGVSPQISSNTQTSLLRAAIDGKAPGLRPGQLIAVEVATGDKTGFDVPLAAVAHDGDQAVVFVRTSDGFEARPVSVTSASGQRARIVGEMKAGEQIAVSAIVALKGAWQNAKGAK